MQTAILAPEVQEFLRVNERTPLSTFILKGSPFPKLTIQELAQQLEGRRKVKDKLPLWYETAGILFPPKINIEQTSSEATARYKAQLITGKTVVDGTGGFGIDSYYFAQQVDQVIHIEMNAEVSAFAKANYSSLGVSNVECIVDNSIAYFAENDRHYDTIYLDPGRRSDVKGKVFMMQDCIPNVPEHLDLLLSRSNQLWIKTAPLLDISAGWNALKNVSQLHIVAVRNEVKELLWCVNASPINASLELTVVNILKDGNSTVSFNYDALLEAQATFGPPLSYLYEPNAALMKSGAFNWISEQYELFKLHENSHLYSSQECIPFPGRVFKIEAVLPYGKSLRKDLKLPKANISTRNFPISVADLRKKLKIKDGGTDYLFFTSLEDNSMVVIHCHKVE
jgi:hypothetical protein